MKKKKTVFLTAIILLLALVTIEGCTCVYGSQKEEFVTIYKIGDNSVTKEVSISEIDQYVNDTYVWSIEPTTLMYAADGRTSYIWNSEVELYKAVCWSIYPPVTIYGKNGATRSCLVEEKQAYLDSGYWFATKEEAIGTVKELLKENTTMLVKASHSMHFEELVTQLRENYD